MSNVPSSPVLIQPRRFGDDRGWFMETYSKVRLSRIGINDEFVQDNHSCSGRGVLRGLQAPPHAQAKLVRCVRGSILDYAVDLRRGSPTFGRSVSAMLSEQNATQLYVPVGFGHAFVTLEPDTEVIYKVNEVYAPDCEGGVIWNDPALDIDWPLPASGALLSSKDQRLPTLDAFESPFEYDGVPMGALVSPMP